MRADLLSRIDRLQDLATASRASRLRQVPRRYLYALGVTPLRYRFTKRGVRREAGTFFGQPMSVVLPAGTDIYLTGGKTHDSEIRLARFLVRHLQRGDMMVDVGAHFGYFSLLAAHVVGVSGHVVAFEASEAAFDVLAANVDACTPVHAHHVAVTDRAGGATMFEFPTLYSEFNTMDVQQFEHEEWFSGSRPHEVRVSSVTLDAFFEAGDDVPDVIKVDVEGGEYRVVDGARALLTRAQPLVVMEYLAASRQNDAHRQAAALLTELGYQAHSIASDGALVSCSDVEAHMRTAHLESDNMVFAR